MADPSLQSLPQECFPLLLRYGSVSVFFSSDPPSFFSLPAVSVWHCTNASFHSDITLHGLRHTAATLLIADHVDVKTVSRFLGHAETSTTMNIYVHALDEAVEAIPSTFDKLFTVNASKCIKPQKRRLPPNKRQPPKPVKWAKKESC